MSVQDTETLFKKKLNQTIVILVMVIVTMVLRFIGFASHGLSPPMYAPDLIVDYIAVLIYSINLVVFSAIGKDKGKENAIMAFVFGIVTIPLAALVILDRGLLISGYIQSIIMNIISVTIDAVFIVDVILRIAGLALIIVAIVFGILSIVNSVAIIKENAQKARDTAGSMGTTSAARPVVATQPPMSPPPTASSGGGAQFCTSCGASLDSGAAFCNKCGAKV